jgi:hypothetical protein
LKGRGGNSRFILRLIKQILCCFCSSGDKAQGLLCAGHFIIELLYPGPLSNFDVLTLDYDLSFTQAFSTSRAFFFSFKLVIM